MHLSPTMIAALAGAALLYLWSKSKSQPTPARAVTQPASASLPSGLLGFPIASEPLTANSTSDILGSSQDAGLNLDAGGNVTPAAAISTATSTPDQTVSSVDLANAEYGLLPSQDAALAQAGLTPANDFGLTPAEAAQASQNRLTPAQEAAVIQGGQIYQQEVSSGQIPSNLYPLPVGWQPPHGLTAGLYIPPTDPTKSGGYIDLNAQNVNTFNTKRLIGYFLGIP